MQEITTLDLKVLENTFEVACESNLQITHRLELRGLLTSLWYNMEIEKEGAKILPLGVEPKTARRNPASWRFDKHLKNCILINNFSRSGGVLSAS